jgi:hypothetical protein
MKLNRGEPDHQHWKKPFTPRELAATWLALGGCTLVLAVAEWRAPGEPPFTGRWSGLKAAVHDAFGVHGIAAVYGVIGAAFVLAGVLKWVGRR